MSNAASAAITVTVRQTPISYRRLGTVIEQNSCEPARAVDPRRLVERGVDLGHAGQQQDRAEAEQDPDPDEADRRQRGVEVAEPGPGDVAEADARETWLTSRSSDSSQPQMMPAATSGMTWGRNRTVRAIVPRRPVATRWMTRAVTSPSVTGMKLKKTTSRKALRIVSSSSGSLRTVA